MWKLGPTRKDGVASEEDYVDEKGRPAIAAVVVMRVGLRSRLFTKVDIKTLSVNLISIFGGQQQSGMSILHGDGKSEPIVPGETVMVTVTNCRMGDWGPMAVLRLADD